MARMYRTEAALAALEKAVRQYLLEYGAYPPAGETGLRLAVGCLSRDVDYLPGGPPLDGWGRPFRFVPASQYAEPQWEAVEGPRGYYNPDTCQLFSLGADGKAGVNDPTAQADNITNWDKDQSWRAVYTRLQEQYRLERRHKP